MLFFCWFIFYTFRVFFLTFKLRQQPMPPKRKKAKKKKKPITEQNGGDYISSYTENVPNESNYQNPPAPATNHANEILHSENQEENHIKNSEKTNEINIRVVSTNIPQSRETSESSETFSEELNENEIGSVNNNKKKKKRKNKKNKNSQILEFGSYQQPNDSSIEYGSYAQPPETENRKKPSKNKENEAGSYQQPQDDLPEDGLGYKQIEKRSKKPKKPKALEFGSYEQPATAETSEDDGEGYKQEEIEENNSYNDFIEEEGSYGQGIGEPAKYITQSHGPSEQNAYFQDQEYEDVVNEGPFGEGGVFDEDLVDSQLGTYSQSIDALDDIDNEDAEQMNLRGSVELSLHSYSDQADDQFVSYGIFSFFSSFSFRSLFPSLYAPPSFSFLSF